MKPTLSILTPTIPGRERLVIALQEKIASQGGNIEHLILSDNRSRTIGAKRQALLDIARGEYVAFVDDDDDISDDYVAEILEAAAGKPDVITFRQEATYNGQKSLVVFRLGQGDHQFAPDGVTPRDAWHVCAWKRSRIAGCLFSESNYGEDLVWSQQARRRAETTIHIDKVLHYYRHNAETTAAPEPAR